MVFLKILVRRIGRDVVRHFRVIAIHHVDVSVRSRDDGVVAVFSRAVNFFEQMHFVRLELIVVI